LLYFLSLISSIIVRWQRSELSILISRGVGVTNILLLTLFEQGLDFLVGAPLGIALGMALARLMGFSAGVLSFQAREALPVTLRGMNPLLVVAALAVALVARLLPTWQAARQSVVQQERERTRQQEAPFWYRSYLDLLLILPTAYLYRQIGVARALNVLLQAKPQDIYRDPLLVLVPALFVLTGGLLAMRLFPLFMRLLDILAGYLPFITPYLALRQLGRQSQSYISPLLLIIVSLALGVYTFSMLGSLDQWMVDRLYYQNGADVSFSPIPMGGDVDLAAGAEWIPSPEEFAQLPGVQQATRVGRYRTEYLLQGSSWAKGTFLGVDYLGFPSVAWFRRDLAEESLGSMMNLLAVQPEGVLVSEKFLAVSSLAVGDRFPARISLAPDVAIECTLAIVGAYRYFPTTDVKSETVIGNLEYLYTYMGVPFQHEIWIRLRPGASGSPALAGLKDLRIAGIRRQDTPALIAEERARLEQVGVLGTLSIGLLAAGGMAIIGLLIYGFSSMRERAYRFGVLRALGLSMGQAIGQVAGEYGVLTLYGAGAGAAIGAAASALFMPFFGTAGQGPTPLPPLLPLLVGSDIVLIASFFAALTILLQLAVIALAVRRMLFQLLRMG
jgi:putative ABC transport system permease protein